MSYKLKERKIHTSEFVIQKLIFKIKMELGKDYELYDKLPYYWYNYGPISEPITESINHLKENNVLIDNNMNIEYFSRFNGNSTSSSFPELNVII